jgi:hypothetical protein
LKRGGTEAAEENKSYRGFALMNADQEEIAKITRIAKIAEIEKPCRSSFPNSSFPLLPPFLRVSKVWFFLISVHPR